jgi:hypothetical protein
MSSIHNTYRTLCFGSTKSARENETDIKNYFGEKVFSSGIHYGEDERGNTGWYVAYTLIEKNINSGNF